MAMRHPLHDVGCSSCAVQFMSDQDIQSLKRAASERQLAVAALQKKYAESESVSTEQLVLDMRELLATERVVLDAIITLFVRIGNEEDGSN
jgi:hypothetical protein